MGVLQVVAAAGKKRLKDTGQHLGRDAKAVVRHHKADRVLAGAHLDMHLLFLTGFLREGDAVGDKACQHHHQLVGVQHQVDLLLRQGVGEVDAAAPHHHLQVVEQVLQVQVQRHQL